jgi:hypothetical protein
VTARHGKRREGERARVRKGREREKDGGREGGRKRENARAKVGWEEDDASARERRARVIITDFPDLILRTVTRHNSLTQIAHERM